MKNKKLMWLYILSAAIYSAQGFEGVVGLPLFAYLKEQLNLTPEKIMYLSSIITIPWLIKPIFGYFIDQYLTKKFWILMSLIGSIVVSLFFGLSPFLTLPLIIIASLFGSYFTANRDIANDGLACVEGKENNTCNIFQNVQWTSITITGIFTGLVGGFIAEKLNYKFAYLSLIPLYLLILWIISKYKSEPTIKQSTTLWKTIVSYKELFTNKNFMLGCLLIFMFNYSPSFGVPLQFIERNNFQWNWSFMGIISAISSAVSIIGSLIYWKYSKKLNIKKVLYFSIFASAGITLCYLYFTPISAIVYSILFSVAGMFIFLNIMTFMAKSTLKNKEAVSFAFLCSVNNLAGTCSSLTGAWLYPLVGLKWLIILSALTSFICLPILKKMEVK